MTQLPKTGFLRLVQILGEKEITEVQAKENVERNRQKALEARQAGRLNKAGKPQFTRLPTKPRLETPPIIPVSTSTWWEGVKDGRFPRPVKLGPRTTAWRVEDIRELIEQ